jgi:acetoin utilization deacetylase AcuC-like enzyme
VIAFFSDQHELHAPEYEFFRGERVPCFESPARANFVRDELIARGHQLREPDADSAAMLQQIHTPRYLAFLQSAWRQWLALDAGNAARQPFPSVWPVRTLRSDVEPANFVAKLGLYSMDNGSPMVAGADFMGGYCFLNNAAVAAQALRAQGSTRVAILDVDYHHGNGTQSIFYDRADVLFVSLHGDPLTEYPFYLGHADEVGEGAGAGFNLNLPLAAGSSVAAWFAALETACARIDRHHADALVVSLGLDTFAGDPISKFALQSADFTRLGERLGQIGLPTIFVLEGGYAAAELGVNAANVMDGFEQG